MAENTVEFVEKGVKIQYSVADKMYTVATTAAFGAASIWTVVGAVAFVISTIKLLTEDTKVAEALVKLQKQIDEMQSIIKILDDRLDDLVEDVVKTANRDTLGRLDDIADQLKVLQVELADRPLDLETAVRVANEAGIVCDKFLRRNYDIWRFADVVLNWRAAGETQTLEPEPALGNFKNMPTLPVYVLGLLIWLGARERVVRAGQGQRLAGDAERLAQHLHAVSIRTNFDKYDPALNIEDPAFNASIAENIKYRIRAYVTASTTHAVNDICKYYFQVGSVMTGRRLATDPFDVYTPGVHVLCSLNPGMIGSPDQELLMEDEAGLAALAELATTIGRVAAGGPLVQPEPGTFSTDPSYVPAILYFVKPNGDLVWYRNEESSKPDGSLSWDGPKVVRQGWGGHAQYFNAGWHASYYVDAQGNLFGNSHHGVRDGALEWSGPGQAGSGWNQFKTVFSHGEYIIYGVHQDGRLLWYKHRGAPFGSGPGDWEGPRQVGTGWNQFERVFSGGNGVIYAVQHDGALLRYIHKGYLEGNEDWGPIETIGSGWNGLRHVVGSADGVIYAIHHDGTVNWYRYGKRPPPMEFVPGIGMVPMPDITEEFWEGPVTVLTGLPASLAAFAVFDKPFDGPS